MTRASKGGKPSYKDATACLEYMQQYTARHLPKDRLFLPLILKYFRPGTTLEIGAGIGQLSRLLQDLGLSVITSDIEPWIIDYMRASGLTARLIDCLNIKETTGCEFDNILAQGPSPFVTSDLTTVSAAYKSVFDALRPGGRFIFILPNFKDISRFSKMKDHWPLIKQTGFDLVSYFRHQIFPSPAYKYMTPLLHSLVEGTIGRYFGTRHIVVLERPSTQ